MSDQRQVSSWIMAVVSWLVASTLVGGGFIVYSLYQGQSIRWDLIREAALMVAPIALFIGWRDSRRKR